jgi:hypothetical protein
MTQEEIDKEASKYPHERTFKAGFQFAQSKMYSEQEVLQLLLSCPFKYSDNKKEWFETNKK